MTAVGRAITRPRRIAPAPRDPEPNRPFEIRWREPIGRKECPFVIRWVITMWDWSLRLHHWLASDDLRHHHDHAWDFWVLVLRGGYHEHTPLACEHGEGTRITWRGPGSFTFYPAEHKHKVQVDKRRGAWSLVLSKPKRRDPGYWVPGRTRALRYLRYFSRYGLHPCE